MSESTTATSLEAVASALGAAGYAIYSMTLVGHAAPIHDRYRERVTHPEPGDLVVETSSFPMRDGKGFGHVAVGTLVSSGVEHIVELPNEDEPEGWEYDEQAWYVDPIMGDETIRWTNADFIAIPRSQKDAWAWKGQA